MAVLVLVALYLVRSRHGGSPPDVAPSTPSPRPPAEQPSPVRAAVSVAGLFQSHRSNVEIETGGRVIRLLPDDRDGSPHQRFLLRADGGTTVLVAHNLDLAQRVALAPGDSIELRGEYEWNPRGGAIHWTHPDPEGRHEAGWIVRR